jgi:hypothetical protein
MNTGRQEALDEADDELSPDVVLTLWSYRRTIAIGMALTAICAVIAVLLVYLLGPRERVASLAFQLTFEGADRQEYPNGVKFSSAELVSTPILADVFRANDLDRYVTFDKFKDAVFVLQTNRDLELLSYEYEAKLSDSKLSPVDRARLEEEFRKKRMSLSSAGYSLNIRRREALVKIPDAMLSKILQDTLSNWAKLAAENKGAMRYNISVLSKNALQKDSLAREDYIIAADMLRTYNERILKTVILMGEIPGANAVRMNPDKIGIADLRASLEDLNRFKIEPLISMIREAALSRSPTRLSQYFESRRFDVQLAKTETTQRIKSMQEALRDYEQRGPGASAGAGDRSGSSVTPQLTESFIDRLVQITTQSIDVEYRQKLTKRIIDDGMVLAELNRQAEYYQSMVQSFSSVRGRADSAVETEITRRTGQVLDEVIKSLDQVEAFYLLLSQQNLNPNTEVYTVTTPFVVRSTSGLSFTRAALYLFVVLLVAMVAIPLGCLIHDHFRPALASSVSPPDTQGTADGARSHATESPTVGRQVIADKR